MKFFTKISPFLLLTSLSVVGVVSLNFSFEQDLTSVAHAHKVDRVTQVTETVEKPLVVIAYLQVKPEYRQTFLDLANNVAKMTNENEEGVNSYVFYESIETPNLFFFFEDWQNEAAFESHLQQTYTKSLTDKYSEILVEPADVRIYDIENIEQLQIP